MLTVSKDTSVKAEISIQSPTYGITIVRRGCCIATKSVPNLSDKYNNDGMSLSDKGSKQNELTIPHPSPLPHRGG
jgi:hypothetical protein